MDRKNFIVDGLFQLILTAFTFRLVAIQTKICVFFSIGSVIGIVYDSSSIDNAVAV